MRATKAIIHLSSFRRNIEAIRNRLSPRTMLCVPVKADAYGHGAVQCAHAAVESGADFLGVATVPEGTELRDAGISTPVLLFGPPMPDEISELVAHNLCPFVFEPYIIRLLNEEAARRQRIISVHLKIDTGMGRIGCPPEDAASIAALISTCSHLKLGGMCTHFAVSDSLDAADVEFTREQFRQFNEAISSVRKAKIDPGICHCANSGTFLLYEQTHLDMVRPGIMVYGYYPGDYRNGKPVLAEQQPIGIEPVMDLVTQISAIKEIGDGVPVSYGRRWTSKKPTRIATLPLGYADGLKRQLSPAGLKVAVRGQPCRVTGTICMDQCMIDLTAVPDADYGDAVVVFGSTNRNALKDAGGLAEIAGTIPYEILTSISRRVPRIYRG
jgi:alanine racemase